MRFLYLLMLSSLLVGCVGTRQSEYMFDRGDYNGAARGMPTLAEQGDPVAQMDMGYLYEHGLGVPQDMAKAQEFYAKAGAQGIARADVCLAVLLMWNKQIPHDMPRAVELLKRADAAGDRFASAYLSHLYKDGDGVPKDDAEAARYEARGGTEIEDTMARYIREMRSHIAANQYYPATAASGHYGGDVTVDFNIQAPYAKDAKIAVSSGHQDLDDAAIAAVYQTYYPSLPPGIWPAEHFTLTIHFG